MYFPTQPHDSSDVRPRSTVADRLRWVPAWGHRHPRRFTIMFVTVVFLVASVLPLWTAW